MNDRKPLNGEKTHPLKPGSIRVLERLLCKGPQPRHEINPGVRDRLHREDLVEECDGIKGRPLVRHLRITAAGRARLDELDENI